MRANPHTYSPGMVDYDNRGTADHKAVIEWTVEDGEFSMSASIWQPSMRDIVCGGQCVDTVAAYFPEDAKAQRMAAIWGRWHLNHMRAGCEHQRGAWDVAELLQLTSLSSTMAFYKLGQRAKDGGLSAVNYAYFSAMVPGVRALTIATDRPKSPEAWGEAGEAALAAGWVTLAESETKRAGWVYPHEHPRGLLAKACDECGYKYGTQWRKEEVPADVLAEIAQWSE